MPVSFYEVIWIFLIYGFLGWCTEVAYAALDTGKFVNRGFLNGPICPIYGVGILVVAVVLTPLKENLLLLFLGSVLLTTAIELITGFLMEKIFHNQWWDYSNLPFNFHGYICLKFSILWGLACSFVMGIVHPLIMKLVEVVPFMAGMVLMLLFLTVFGTDLAITVSSILKFNKHLRLMDELGAKLKLVSDEIGENIYENVTGALEKTENIKEKTGNIKEKFMDVKENFQDNFQEKLEDVKENLQDNFQEKKTEALELQKRYMELAQTKGIGFKRLLKAFPNMKSNKHQDSLNRLKSYINGKRDR